MQHYPFQKCCTWNLEAPPKAAGQPLEGMDMLIAAHAIAVGAIVVTADNVFNSVAGLAGKENWATDLLAL